MKKTNFLTFLFIFIVFMSSISSAYTGTYNQQDVANQFVQALTGLWNISVVFWITIVGLIGIIFFMKIIQ